MGDAYHRRLQRWCAMALLECYESCPSKDLKSTVISVIDEILASKPVTLHPTDPEIPADGPLAMRSRLETIVPPPIQTELRQVVSDIDHPVQRHVEVGTPVHETVSVETIQTLRSSSPPAHNLPTPRTSSPETTSSLNTRLRRGPVGPEISSTSNDPSTRHSTPSRSPVTRSKTRTNPSQPTPMTPEEQEVAEESSSKRRKTTHSQAKRKAIWTSPAQIPRFPRLSKNIAVRRQKSPFEIAQAECIVREQTSAPAHTNQDERLDGINNMAVSLTSLREQITQCLSTRRLEESATAFATAVQAVGYMYDSPSYGTALVQEWRTILMMRDRRVVPDVRWRIRHVILGQEFARRLKYRYTSISIVDWMQRR